MGSTPATSLFRRLPEDDGQAHVSDLVLCELVWVLGRGYGHDRGHISAALVQLLATKQLRFDHPDRLQRALVAYARGPGDFADYLIREHARTAGCDEIVTFDRKLHKDEMFVAP